MIKLSNYGQKSPDYIQEFEYSQADPDVHRVYSHTRTSQVVQRYNANMIGVLNKSLDLTGSWVHCPGGEPPVYDITWATYLHDALRLYVINPWAMPLDRWVYNPDKNVSWFLAFASWVHHGYVIVPKIKHMIKEYDIQTLKVLKVMQWYRANKDRIHRANNGPYQIKIGRAHV